MITIIIQTISIFGILGFMAYWVHKTTKIEKERFREFVRAIKAKDVGEYNISIEEEEKEEEKPQQEFIDPYEADPKAVLRALKK